MLRDDIGRAGAPTDEKTGRLFAWRIFEPVAIFATALLACLPVAAQLSAGDYSSLYDRSKLEADKPRLQQAMDYVLNKEIQPYLPEAQRLGFGLLPIDEPLPIVLADPFSIYSENRHIEFPLLSMLFVEDMARAYSWLWTNRFSTRTVDEYLAMLRYRKPGDFSDQRYPAPLSALHIPENALSDQRVVEMAVRTRRTAYAFLLLHEYAHVRLQQDPYGRGTTSEAVEEQADEFALDVLKKNSSPPTGVWLVMQGWLLINAGDKQAGHPVTPHRLEAMAHYLEGHVIEFVRGRPNQAASKDVIHSIASLLRQASEASIIPGNQAEVQNVALRTDIGTLLPRPLPRNTR